MNAKGNESLHCSCHTGRKTGKRTHRLNFRSFIAFFLSAVLLFTSSDCLQIYAEGTNSNNQAVVMDEAGGAMQLSADAEAPNEAETSGEGGANPANPGNGAGNSETSGEVMEGSANPGNAEDDSKTSGEGGGSSETPGESGGSSENPDEGEGDSKTPGEGGENPENPGEGEGDSKTPGEGGENPENPGEGEGDSKTPGEGGENPENPGEGEGDSKTPGEGGENPENPGEGEENPENPGEGVENPKTPGEGEGNSEKPNDEKTDKSETTEALKFVRTSEGAVIISSFEPLLEAAAHIILEKKGTLAEAVSLMPSLLKVYAYAYIEKTETKGNETEDTETDKSETEKTETDKSETKKSNAEKAGTEEAKSEKAETEKAKTGKAETETTKTGKTETETTKTGKTETETAKADKTETEAAGTDKAETETDKSVKAETEKSETETSGTEKTDAEENKTEADSSQKTGTTVTTDPFLQELMVPVSWECSEDYEGTELEAYVFRPVWDGAAYFYDENEAAADGDQGVTGGDRDKDVTDGDKDAAGKDKEAADKDKEAAEKSKAADKEITDGDKDAAGKDKEAAEKSKAADKEIADGDKDAADKDKEAADANTETNKETGESDSNRAAGGDKESTEEDETAKEDEAAEGGEAASGIPAITVSFSGEAETVKSVVSTQEELAAALAAGLPKITLAADISLTETMVVPAAAHTVLDGKGFSLLRGKDGNGVFVGTMLYLGGEDYTERAYGRLTLTDITVDGKTTGDHAESSAIIDYGSLILEAGAVVKNNYNYGTYGKGKAIVNDYGGGIQVYNELVVTQDSLVTGNFADEFGGGVYLADGALLYLYADVIKKNTVAAGTGYGEDLYAASGSTIYYDASIDMEREGFYICAGVTLIPMQAVAEYSEETPEDRDVEIYINTDLNSGYTDEQVAELIRKLEARGYTVLSDRRTDIDTTDLRNWYVYDHYEVDNKCWGVGVNQYGAQDLSIPSAAWKEAYGGNPKRPYYGFREANVWTPNRGGRSYTIADWLGRIDDYVTNNILLLAQFKEHIYTRNEAGTPKMTFAGYGKPAYIDFLFYDPESNGEKVVDFDVDCSQINTHTLAGSGFLVNTGISDDKLYGYLVYYAYAEGTTTAQSLEVYRVNGVNVDIFHGGTYNIKILNHKKMLLGDPIETYQIEEASWEDEMSIQIKATPTKIEVRQQPKASTQDISQTEPVLSCTLGEGGGLFNGFGPAVAYAAHDCNFASSFTYSNLRMYYTSPELEREDMLNPLKNADYTQEGTQKYFLNLFGSSDLEYNDSANFGQYQEYLKMMQKEGIALITDRATPFEDYLGKDEGGNLYEIGEGESSVDALVEKIAAYVGGKTTTDLAAKLQEEEGEEGLKNASPNQSVGNIWLKSAASNEQVRKLYAASFAEGGYTVQIMDDISYYYNRSSDINITYDILKPGAASYVTLDTKTLTSGGMDGSEPSAPASFVISKASSDWPTGHYTVRQRISGSSIYGYAYFNLYSDYSSVGTANYKVEHYKQKPDGSGYIKEEADTQELEELIGECVTARPKAYPGFTENAAHAERQFSGIVSADGSLTLKLFYDRDIYNISFDLNGGGGVELPTQTIRYGNRLEAVADPTRRGYNFKGWYKSKAAADEDISDDAAGGTDDGVGISLDTEPWNFDENVEDNISERTVKLYARWRDEIAPVLGEASYNLGYKDLADWIIRKKDLVITVPITEEGSGVDRAEYTLTPESGDSISEETQLAEAYAPRQVRRSASIQLKVEDAQVYAEITISEDFKGTVSLKCNDKAGNASIPKTLTIAGGGVIVEDNAPEITFSSKKGENNKTVVEVSVSDDVNAEGNSRITGGIAKISYHIDDNTEQELDGKDAETGKGFADGIVASYAFSVEISGAGNHNLSVTALDNAGNENSKTTQVSIEEEKKKPKAVRKSSKKSNPVSVSNTYSEPEKTEFVPFVQTAAPRDNEPDTGDNSVHVMVYATVAMIAGMFYLLLYFSTGKNGMTEEEKNEFVSRLLGWAKRGSKCRRFIAIAAIFWVLFYYHSIGKRIGVEWKEVYGK